MRTLVALALAALCASGCGAKTALEVDERVERPDAGIGPCEPTTPALFSAERLLPMAVEGGRVWGRFRGPELAVGYLDHRAVRWDIAREQFGTAELVAEDGVAWWQADGFSDGAGTIVRGTADGDMRVLNSGLTQPGALSLHPEWLAYATDTNLPGPGDPARAAVVRIDRRTGGLAATGAVGRGMPTATAHLGDELFWVDRRRQHVARLPEGSREPRIVAEIRAIRRPMVEHGGVLYIGAGLATSDVILRVERSAPPEPGVVTRVDGEVRGLDALPSGLVIELFESGRSRLAYWRFGDATLHELGPGRSATADTRHLYWSTDEGTMRVCLEYLAAL